MRKVTNSTKVSGLLALVLSAHFAFAAAIKQKAPAAAPNVYGQIPSPISPPRADAPYGTYFTPVAKGARPLQDRLLELEQKIFGVAKFSTSNPVAKAEAVYNLEHRLVRLHQDIANAPGLDPFERESLLTSTVHDYRNLRMNSEHLFEDMVRFIDVKLPGPNGGQFRIPGLSPTRPFYQPNYRLDNQLEQHERDKLYTEKVQEFKLKGGELSEIKVLNKDLVKGFESLTKLEYVIMRNGEIRVTPGKAGHILLAGGEPVLSAGQLTLVKDDLGNVTMAIVSNGSGSYKPDLNAVYASLDDIAAKAGVKRENIVVTKGEPMTTQAIKIYMKALGKPKEEIDSFAKRVEAEAKAILSRIVNCGPSLANIFSAP